MKKIIVAIALVGLLIISTGAWAARTTGAIAADTLIRTGAGCLYSIVVKANGTDAASVTLYDNTTNSGKVIRAYSVAAGEFHAGETKSSCTMPFATGLYVDVGTNTTVYIDWDVQ